MDWTKQMEEMTKTWTDVQKSVWSTWTDAGQGMTDGQIGVAWAQMLENWRKSMDMFLDAQNESIHLWVDSVKQTSGLPDGMADSVDQLQKMVKQWTASQKALWDNWFQFAQKIEPKQMPDWMGMDGQSMMKFWQEMSNSAMEAQSEWLKALSGWQPAKK